MIKDYSDKDLVSISEFDDGDAERIFTEVKQAGIKIVMKDDCPECVMISPEKYSELIEKYNDMQLLLTAISRVNNSKKNDIFTQEEVDKMFDLNTFDINDDIEIN